MTAFLCVGCFDEKLSAPQLTAEPMLNELLQSRTHCTILDKPPGTADVFSFKAALRMKKGKDMFLNDAIISDRIKRDQLLKYTEEECQPLSVDLHIDSVLFWKVNGKAGQGEFDPSDIAVFYQTPFQLKPHETVFVKAKEELNMPRDLVGCIVEKNGVMRLGLQVSGPMYQPTHNTAIFLRVTNLTEYIITLNKGFAIAQIYFEEAYPPNNPYSNRSDAKYTGEFEFKAPEHLITESIDPKEQMVEEIKTVENKMLTTFTVFMGAFVSSLALIVVNFNTYTKIKEPRDIIFTNALLSLCIAAILISVFWFSRYLNKSRKKGGKNKLKKKSQPAQEMEIARTVEESNRDRKPKIYLAARYSEHKRNQKLSADLRKAGLNVFLPEDMNLKESTDSVMKKIVFHRCYHELYSSDIVVVVSPFGKSVSAELGFAIAYSKLMICYHTKNEKAKSECMIDPGFSYEVQSQDELVRLLKKLT